MRTGRLALALAAVAMSAPAGAAAEVVGRDDERRRLPPHSYSPVWNDGKYDPRVPMSHARTQRERRRDRRRGGR